MGPPDPAEARSNAKALAVAALFFCVAFGLRALSWPRVLVGDSVVPPGWDAFYHFRRILYGALHFPATLTFDRYLNFPAGGQPIWSPPFDWLAAGLVRMLRDAPDASDVERITIWLPPLLGALCVASVYLLVRRRFSPGGAAVAAAALCIVPIHAWYSQLGFVDHHAAVAWLALLLLAATLGLARVLVEDAPTVRTLGVRAVLLGAGMGFAVALWPGCLLHVSLVTLVWVTWLALPSTTRGAARRGCASLSAAYALAAVVVAPLSVGRSWVRFGEFTPVVLSDFHPWFFALLALWFAAGLLAIRLGAWERPLRRAGFGLGAGVLLLAASGLLSDSILRGIGDALAWFGRDESFQASILESRPLLFGNSALGFGRALEQVSGLLLLVPLLAIVVVAAARTPRERLLHGIVAGWALAWLAVSLMQMRFSNTFATAAAVLLGAAVAGAPRLRAARLPDLADRRWLLAALLVVAAPAWGFWSGQLSDAARALRGEPIAFNAFERSIQGAIETTAWLGRNTPETAGYLDPDAIPAYGVIAGVNLGHAIVWKGRRPSFIGNFGDDVGAENFELAELFAELDEEEAWQRMDEARLRYVISRSAPSLRGLPRGTIARQLRAPLVGPQRSPPGEPGPRHFRLVFESSGSPGARYRIFERVAGARITGSAPPGNIVEARVDVVTNRGSPHRHRGITVADASGRYTLVVPYATVDAAPAVVASGPYVVRCRQTSRELPVSEADVLRGTEIAGPSCE